MKKTTPSVWSRFISVHQSFGLGDIVMFKLYLIFGGIGIVKMFPIVATVSAQTWLIITIVMTILLLGIIALRHKPRITQWLSISERVRMFQALTVREVGLFKTVCALWGILFAVAFTAVSSMHIARVALIVGICGGRIFKQIAVVLCPPTTK